MTAVDAKKRIFFTVLITSALFCIPQAYTQEAQIAKEQEPQAPLTEEIHNPEISAPRTIRTINIIGNKQVPLDTIKRKIPYVEGDIFDPALARKAIINLDALKRFKNVQIKAHNVGADQIDLYIIVEEKIKLKEVILKGNTHLTEKELRKKRDLSNLPGIEPEDLQGIARDIKSLYAEKNYLNVDVIPELTIEDDTAVAVFTVTERSKSLVKKVRFKGNDHVSGKQLRSIIFTREDWLLGFMDKAGSYSPERLDADRHIIEQYYQNHGYLTAKVTDVSVDVDEKTKNLTVIFTIREGDLYTISDVSIPGNEFMNEEYLKNGIPLKAGDVYSREKIVESIKMLEVLWGEFGYINSSVEPAILPNEVEKTVSISFFTELGNKVYLNRLNIIGNKKTQDKVIRRRISLEEGNLVTTRGMDESKGRVENLGYFETRDGVNWKIKRLAENLVDLDLIVKETKTGHAHLKMGYGGSGDIMVPNSSLSVGGEIVDTNLFGSGMSFNLNANLSKDERNLFFNITQPWLFDKPITLALDIYHRRPTYDDFNNIGPVNEILTGGAVTLGFITRWLDDTQIMFRGGVDSLRYDSRPRVLPNINDPIAVVEYQHVLDQVFTPGDFAFFSLNMAQDRRNNPIHTSHGYRWNTSFRFGLPTCGSNNIGFYRFDADAYWFTPLIGEYDLVFKIHGFLGFSGRLKNHIVPYRELFHIGGPASVRGFLFGQIGPKWQDAPATLRGSDPLGAGRAFFVNAELIFPIKPDMTVKGVAFYDGGAGWAFPYANEISSQRLINNCFNYRHSVGVGLRMLEPMPLRIDWGFKIDPVKALRESGSEVHLSMTYDW